MNEPTSGTGPLFTNPSADEARAFYREKSRRLTDKIMSVKDAVTRFVNDGDYLASGGFGTNRISTAVMHEIVRQKKRNLMFAGHTTTHDFQILCAGNRNGEKLLSRVDSAYIVGLEARGLSPQARRVMQSGEVEICEWSNYAMAVRLRAAVMGLPYLPTRCLLGTDTFARSAAKMVECPFTHTRLAAVPALYPDVSAIHVHESDRFGNCRIHGITIADFDLARASKRLIITTERIISNDEIRNRPDATTIPAYCVDAVCEVRYGSYPGNMPGEYFSDERHLKEWLTVERDEQAYDAFLQKYIHGVASFEQYVELCGGKKRIEELRAEELLEKRGKGA
ncbi:MAG: CoA transferase subunit A [Spirochaetales bacterium]|nr:CoA transferase subunit A [Spirochaetales bacterium]